MSFRGEFGDAFPSLQWSIHLFPLSGIHTRNLSNWESWHRLPQKEALIPPNCPIFSGKHHQVCGVIKPPDGEANHLVKEFGSPICEKIISLRFVKNTTVVNMQELKFDIFRNGLPFKYRTREPEYQRRNAMLCYDCACWLTEQNYRNYSSPKPSQHSSSGTVRTGKHESETNCKLTPEPEFQHCSSLSV